MKLQFIRRMSISDLDEVVPLDLAVFQNTDWSFDYFEECLKTPETSCWIIEEIDENCSSLIAFCVQRSLNGETHLLNICVDPHWQGIGIGQKLLQHVINHATHLGDRSVKLEVRVDNDRAKNLYRKFGFFTVGHILKYYADGMDALVMRLYL